MGRRKHIMKKNSFNWAGLFVVIVIALFSLFVAMRFNADAPSLSWPEFNTTELGNQTFDDGNICSEFETTFKYDETRINDGDLLNLIVDYSDKPDNTRFFVKLPPEGYVEILNKPVKFEQVYYKNGKNKFRYLLCFNDNVQISENLLVEDTIELRIKPFLLGGVIGKIIVFLSTFALVGELIWLIKRFIFKKNC